MVFVFTSAAACMNNVQFFEDSSLLDYKDILLYSTQMAELWLEGGMSIVGVACMAYSPVWLRSYRLDKSMRIVKNFSKLEPKVSKFPRDAQPNVRRSIQWVGSFSNQLNGANSGLGGFIQDRGGRSVTNNYSLLQREITKLQLLTSDLERGLRAQMLLELRSLPKNEVSCKLGDAISVSAVRQTSSEDRIHSLKWIQPRLESHDLKEQADIYLTVLQTCELLDEMKHEHSDSVLLGGNAIKQVRGLR